MNMQTRINRTLADFPASRGFPGTVSAVLADGALALVWHIESAICHGLRCQVLAADGRTERIDFVIEAEAINRAKKPRVTALDGGGFRISWVEKSTDGARIVSEEIRPLSL